MSLLNKRNDTERCLPLILLHCLNIERHSAVPFTDGYMFVCTCKYECFAAALLRVLLLAFANRICKVSLIGENMKSKKLWF